MANTTEKTMVITFNEEKDKGASIPFRGYRWVDEAIDFICYKENNKTPPPMAKVGRMHIMREIYANGIALFLSSRGYPTTEDGWKEYLESTLEEAIAEVNA